MQQSFKCHNPAAQRLLFHRGLRRRHEARLDIGKPRFEQTNIFACAAFVGSGKGLGQSRFKAHDLCAQRLSLACLPALSIKRLLKLGISRGKSPGLIVVACGALRFKLRDPLPQ